MHSDAFMWTWQSRIVGHRETAIPIWHSWHPPRSSGQWICGWRTPQKTAGTVASQKGLGITQARVNNKMQQNHGVHSEGTTETSGAQQRSIIKPHHQLHDYNCQSSVNTGWAATCQIKNNALRSQRPEDSFWEYWIFLLMIWSLSLLLPPIYPGTGEGKQS